MTQFIYEHLRYPPAAFEANVEGTVLLDIDIDFQGQVLQTRVLQGLGHGCDEEAARVARLLKFEVGKNRGVKVLFHKKIKIAFKKPPTKAEAPQPAPPTALQVQYTYTAAPAPAPKPQEPATPVYTYTIQL